MTEQENPPRRRRRLVWLWFFVIVVLLGGSVVGAWVAADHPTSGKPKPTPSSSVLGETFNRPGTSPAPSPSGTTAQEPDRPMTVTGTSPRGLGPGITRTLTVTVTNPNDEPMVLTAVSIAVGDGSIQCHAQGNITVTSYQSTAPGAATYVAPARGQITLPLSITMLDTAVNQDVCKNVTFPLTFSASGHEA